MLIGRVAILGDSVPLLGMSALAKITVFSQRIKVGARGLACRAAPSCRPGDFLCETSELGGFLRSVQSSSGTGGVRSDPDPAFKCFFLSLRIQNSIQFATKILASQQGKVLNSICYYRRGLAGMRHLLSAIHCFMEPSV